MRLGWVLSLLRELGILESSLNDLDFYMLHYCRISTLPFRQLRVTQPVRIRFRLPVQSFPCPVFRVVGTSLGFILMHKHVSVTILRT